MYQLITDKDIKKSDIIVIREIKGRSVKAEVLDTSKPQIRQGPKWSRIKKGINGR